jgi:hypothetical protein
MNLVTFRGLLAHVGVDILIFTLIVLLLGVAVVTKTHPHGNALYAAEFDFVPDSSWVRIDPPIVLMSLSGHSPSVLPAR